MWIAVDDFAIHNNPKTLTFHSVYRLTFSNLTVDQGASWSTTVTHITVEILGMLSLYHSFLVSFSVEILRMFRH